MLMNIPVVDQEIDTIDNKIFGSAMEIIRTMTRNFFVDVQSPFFMQKLYYTIERYPEIAVRLETAIHYFGHGPFLDMVRAASLDNK